MRTAWVVLLLAAMAAEGLAGGEAPERLVIQGVTTNSPVTAGEDIVVTVKLAPGQEATKLWLFGAKSGRHGLDAWFADEIVAGASGEAQDALAPLSIRVPTTSDL